MHDLRVLPSARRDLDSLDPQVFRRIKPRILALGANPRPGGCVKLTAGEGYRIRAGDYRVLYRVDDRSRIVFYRVKHRREAYRIPGALRRGPA